MERRLEGKVAIVTGGAQGIGRAVVDRLLSEGACVIVWDSAVGALDAISRELGGGGQVAVDAVDITDDAAVEAAAARLVESHGTLDVLVHSAGIAGPTMPVADYPAADWRRVIDVDLNGAFNVNRAVVRRMIAQARGRIVNIASVAGKEGNPNAAAYSAAKAGLIALTKSLGKETAAHDIAVNVITPAAAKTRILDQVSQAHIDYMLSKIPRGRFVTVDEIAALVAWLASDENSFTTGAVFDISGGRATY